MSTEKFALWIFITNNTDKIQPNISAVRVLHSEKFNQDHFWKRRVCTCEHNYKANNVKSKAICQTWMSNDSCVFCTKLYCVSHSISLSPVHSLSHFQRRLIRRFPHTRLFRLKRTRCIAESNDKKNNKGDLLMLLFSGMSTECVVVVVVFHYCVVVPFRFAFIQINDLRSHKFIANSIKTDACPVCFFSITIAVYIYCNFNLGLIISPAAIFILFVVTFQYCYQNLTVNGICTKQLNEKTKIPSKWCSQASCFFAATVVIVVVAVMLLMSKIGKCT